MKKITVFFCYILTIFSLCSCSYYKNFRSLKHHNYHIVKPGETLYSIAKKHNIKLEQLIKVNNIRAPHTLSRGQRLKLSTLHQHQSTLSKSRVLTTKKPQTIKTEHNYNKNENYNTQESVKYHNNKNWAWPTNGPIIKQFIANGPNKVNGIDIIGKKGDPIISTANGKVVYSGNNLRGYGNLIIIKHDKDFLSAYAHNEKILVKEQQTVTKGQQIATMGDSEATRVVLHFEIRYKGKPIDPLQVLAKK